MDGVIARLVAAQDFGFVRGADGVERFFHRSMLRGTTFDALRIGQPVTSEEQGPRQPRAARPRRPGTRAWK